MRPAMTSDSAKNKRLVGLFLLGCVLFNYPILYLFNLEFFFLGLPLIYIYMFVVWSLLIFAIMFITKIRSAPPPNASRAGKYRGI
jgi:hypothetical protein